MTKPAIIKLNPAAPLSRLPDCPESEIASGARGSSAGLAFHDEGLGLMVGVWEAEANIGRWLDYPSNELVIVLDGDVVMAEPDCETVIGPGEAVVIPRGTRCAWHQAGRVRKFFMSWPGNAPVPATRRRVMKIDPRRALAPSPPPDKALLHSAAPVQHAHEYFADGSGQFTAGLWDTTGYHRKLIDFPRHELMHLLEGSVTFTDDAGEERNFRAGDTFFVPRGTPNAWKSEGYLRKIYCILQPA